MLKSHGHLIGKRGYKFGKYSFDIIFFNKNEFGKGNQNKPGKPL